MQAVESETLILYHTDLRGQWPAAAARTLAARLPYGKHLALGGGGATARSGPWVGCAAIGRGRVGFDVEIA